MNDRLEQQPPSALGKRMAATAVLEQHFDGYMCTGKDLHWSHGRALSGLSCKECDGLLHPGVIGIFLWCSQG